MKSAETIRRLRLGLTLQQDEFAKIFKVTTGTISNWETGHRSPRLPKVREIIDFAAKHKIKLTIEDFLD